MYFPNISLVLLSALAVKAEFYIVGTSGEFADGYYGFPAVINDQGITFGDALACDHVGTAGSLKKTTNDKGQLLYEFCDVNDVAFAFNDHTSTLTNKQVPR
ncbi:hypothetical protein GRF29_103g120585 [Pseudopithomyces chartarum]|uniref:Uncharacterized protein n=1 Tax=Pseudopithomyces chartarum TaxID=1892770 RepID=A0AAN6LXP1_9PLEO|nr:hypothetical protein GRF29_103g120585 [Pseudopithomyces chartarum]